MSRLAPLRVGDVIKVAEDAYYYGAGSLTMRVTDVHGLVYLDDGPWVAVDCIPVWPNGIEGEERYAQIRVSGIRFLPEGRLPSGAS